MGGKPFKVSLMNLSAKILHRSVLTQLKRERKDQVLTQKNVERFSTYLSEHAEFIRISGFCRKPFLKENGEISEERTQVVSFEVGLKPGAPSFEVGMRNTTEDDTYTADIIGQFRQEIDSSSDTESRVRR